MKHVLSVLVNNNSGVLSHVSGLFTRRGYNIDSLSVGETHEPGRSIITLVVNEDEQMVRQITKQLYKLIDVIEIADLTYIESATRELILANLAFHKENRQEMLALAEACKAKVVSMNDANLVLEMAGTPREVEDFLHTFREYGILDLARTGTVALPLPVAEKNR